MVVLLALLTEKIHFNTVPSEVCPWKTVCLEGPYTYPTYLTQQKSWDPTALPSGKAKC